MLAAALWLLLLVLAVLLLLVLVALVTPVKLGFSLRTAPGRRVRIVARLFGGLAPPIPVHDSARRRPDRKPAARRKTAAKPRRAAARARRIIAAAPRLAVDLLRPIRLERLRLDADLGLADPADTGQLFGLLAAVDHARPPGSALSIEVRPDFTGSRFSGELEAVVGFVPAAFLRPGIRFAWRVFGPAR